MQCVVCDCSEFDACVDTATGVTCAWIEFEPGRIELADGSGLCTFCARDVAASPARESFLEGMRRAYRNTSGSLLPPERWAAIFDAAGQAPDTPLVQLATDAECDALLRARRAGA